MIFFVQPFGIRSQGGGARILRSLMRDAPMKWRSVAFCHEEVPPLEFGNETWIPTRLNLGRLERGRMGRLVSVLDRLALGRPTRRLAELAEKEGASAIHAVMHTGWETVAASRVAARLHIPFYVSVHDDPAYATRYQAVWRTWLGQQLGAIGNRADMRFVISEELGKELNRRWGKRNYVLVTDGLDKIADRPSPYKEKSLKIYFMGLFHVGYGNNLLALQRALALVGAENRTVEKSVTLRCGQLQSRWILDPNLIRVVPFSYIDREADEIGCNDLLYLPLSFDAADRPMAAFSLSTKLVSYLGSGVPIFYHGPRDSAVGKLLAENNAALICESLEPATIAAILRAVLLPDRTRVAEAALRLARRQFFREDIRERFWGKIDLEKR